MDVGRLGRRRLAGFETGGVLRPRYAVALLLVWGVGAGAGWVSAWGSPPGGVLPVPQARALEILERAAARYRALETVCATFVQRLRVELLRQERTSRGRMCHRRPGLFAMRFTDPAGDVIVADGESLWLYYPSVAPGQVIRSRADGVPGGFDFEGEFLADPDAKYAASLGGTEVVNGRRVYVLKLVPRQRSAYERVTLWIDAEGWLVRRLEIVEENGTVRRLELRDLQIDPRIPADFFRFTPPPGVQVIER